MSKPSDLTPGDRFPSPRADEGVVTVVCGYGACTHDNRPQSVHVRDLTHSEFFIALPDRDGFHVCDRDGFLGGCSQNGPEHHDLHARRFG